MFVPVTVASTKAATAAESAADASPTFPSINEAAIVLLVPSINVVIPSVEMTDPFKLPVNVPCPSVRLLQERFPSPSLNRYPS